MTLPQNDPSLTLLVSLSVAIVAALVTSKLSQQGEKKRNINESIHRLYLPLVPDIVACFETANVFRKHDLAKELTIDELESRISQRFSDHAEYIDSDLFVKFSFLKTRKYFDDLSGTMSRLEIIEFVHVILVKMIKLIRKYGLYPRSHTKQFETYSRYYAIWYKLSTCQPDIEAANRILSQRFLFDHSISDSRRYNRIMKDLEKTRDAKACAELIATNLISDREKRDMLIRSVTITG